MGFKVKILDLSRFSTGEKDSKRNSLNVQISLSNNKLSREDLTSNGSSTLFKMGQQPLLTLPGTLWLWLRSRPNPAEPSQTTPRWHFDFREPFDSSHIYQAESHFSCVWAPSIKKKNECSYYDRRYGDKCTEPFRAHLCSEPESAGVLWMPSLHIKPHMMTSSGGVSQNEIHSNASLFWKGNQ